jgi:Pentapeptide repeats (8 copies)
MKQHRADGVSLVFGLIFLIIAAWWTIGWFVNIDLDIPNVGWVVAFGLIAIGLVGVVGSLRGNGAESTDELTATTGTATTGTANTGTANTGTANTGTANTGTATTGTATGEAATPAATTWPAAPAATTWPAAPAAMATEPIAREDDTAIDGFPPVTSKDD